MAARKSNAAGCATASACRGRSYRQRSATLSAGLTRPARHARCRRCSAWSSSTSKACAGPMRARLRRDPEKMRGCGWAKRERAHHHERSGEGGYGAIAPLPTRSVVARLDPTIQYSRDRRLLLRGCGALDAPPARGMTVHLVTDPQADAAVHGVADRLRPGGAVEEQVGDPALADAEADPAAIFEPALVADRRHDGSVAGHGGDDAGMGAKGLHPAAIDVGFDVRSEQMRPLAADLDQAGAIGAVGDRGVERIERDGGVAVALDPLPELPDLDRGCDLVARRQPADPARASVDAVI